MSSADKYKALNQGNLEKNLYRKWLKLRGILPIIPSIKYDWNRLLFNWADTWRYLNIWIIYLIFTHCLLTCSKNKKLGPLCNLLLKNSIFFIENNENNLKLIILYSIFYFSKYELKSLKSG